MKSEIEIREFDPSKDTPEEVAKVWAEGFGELEKKTGFAEGLGVYDIALSVAQRYATDCYGRASLLIIFNIRISCCNERGKNGWS